MCSPSEYDRECDIYVPWELPQPSLRTPDTTNVAGRSLACHNPNSINVVSTYKLLVKKNVDYVQSIKETRTVISKILR
jgi:hypothetical protein